VYHILIKGEGVLSNASSPAARAKLRLLFEAGPIALIIEAAGGASCVCSSEAAEALAPGGLLVLEHHHDQSAAVMALLVGAGLAAPRAHRDLQGQWRFASARSPRAMGAD
jgi:hypothetical protein